MAIAIGFTVAFFIAGIFRVSSILAVGFAIALPIAGIYTVVNGQAEKFGDPSIANLFQMWWPAAMVLFVAYWIGRLLSGIRGAARSSQ